MRSQIYNFCQNSSRLLLFVACVTASAAPVFKSTDADGNVSYSSSPPVEGQKVEQIVVPESSSRKSPETADSSTQRIKKMAEELEQERLAREQQLQDAAKQAESQSDPSKQENPPVQNSRPKIQNRPQPPKPTPLPARTK